ncbi:MAG TPA: hypothetical protein VEY71_04800, partial [Chitinophagales bacterium]|nr:hypothetical protein [Chitinophagales bacterium]
FLLIAFTALCGFHQAVGQTSMEEFGTNRVQYKEFNWSFYNTDRYSVYFYLGGQELGKFVAMDAGVQMEDVEKLLEYKLQDPVEIMVYNNIEDLKQSNIGRYLDLNNTGGVTKIIGNKIFIYFDGDHNHLRRQLREGIAMLCLQNMLFGGSIQEVLQNAVLLNLPGWYRDGLAAYAGEGWSPELEAELRDHIISGQYKNINKLGANDAILAGHSFWHYIALQYGKPAIPNILYLTRINHSVEAGFSYVINKSFKQVMRDWYRYYKDYYDAQPLPTALQKEDARLPIKTRKDRVYTSFAISPNLDKAAYVVNRKGLYKVYVQDFEKKKRKRILKGGYRDQTMPVDYETPMLAWSPNNTTLAAFYTRRAKIHLLTYDTDEKKKERNTIANFQKVTSMQFGETPNQLLLSAINRGQSDIYTFNISSKGIKQITNDFWDDLDPAWVKLHNRQGIVFTSNRPTDTLQNEKLADTLQTLKNLDVYFYNTKTNDKALVQITNTPDVNEEAPQPYNNTHLSYLTVRNRVYNRNVAYIDSVFHHYDYYYYFPDSTAVNPTYNFDSLKQIGQWNPDSTKQIAVYKDVAHSFADSDYRVGMLKQHVSVKRKTAVEEYIVKGKPYFVKVPLREDVPNTNEIRFNIVAPLPRDTAFSALPATNPLPSDTAKTGNAIDIDNYIFQSEFTQPKSTPADTARNASIEQPFAETNPNAMNSRPDAPRPLFRPTRVLPYTVKFANDYVVSQLDNSIVVTRYQSYATNGGVYQNPQLGGLIKLGITDLFEDYRITGGFRVPTNISGSEYFVSFEDFKGRLDKKYTYYRRVRGETYDFSSAWFLPVNGKVKTNYAEAQLRYPLDYNRRFGVIGGFRQERVVFQATDTFSLGLDDYTENWASLRGEYVFDNTLNVQLNILNGTRYKAYFDVQKLLDEKNFFTFAVGVDARHYERIHRQIVWATRFNTATSWGDAKIAYLLGGVENWIVPKVTQEESNADQTQYAFMALSTNVRGFAQQVRKGSSVALVNTEIRFPVFAYLSNAPIKSEFIKNFQLVGFVDAGTAWLGLSPYSEDNPFNTKLFPDPPGPGPVTVKVNYFREPVVLGTGLGARTTLFGYFLRVDYARGLDSGEWQKPMWHFSLGTDF